MMKTPQIKNTFFKWKELSLLKVVKYASITIGAVIIIFVLLFIFFPDPFINTLVKDRITKAFKEAYPKYSMKLGDMHYNVWSNRLGCDSILLKSNDSTLTCSIGSFSVGGIGWMKILFQSDFNPNGFTTTVIDAQKVVLNFHPSQDEYRFGMLHISLPDSELTIDSIKYHSSLDDQQFFARNQFRQTRFKIDVPKINIVGFDYPKLLRGNIYSARSIDIHDIFADILVNMDKPYDINSTNPQMPNELLSSIKEIVKADSLKIINGRLNYSERFSIGATPGKVTFKKVNVSISGISNNTVHPDTAVIHGEGVFMNSGTMKLNMAIPLASKDFSLRYSGSLSTMDVTVLNSFIEAGEHQRIKSGTLQSASFNVNVNSGYASGSLYAVYKDVNIALLNKDTGSDKGIFNRIVSFFGKVFIIRNSNLPDEDGSIKIGEIKYSRKPADYFFQFLWFALRGGVADVLGFPRE